MEALELCNPDTTFIFKWHGNWSFDKLHSQCDDIDHSRVCYITTQKRRVWLVRKQGNLWEYVPAVLCASGWSDLYAHERVTTEVKPEDLQTAETLRKALEFQIMLQFRDVVHGFYQDPLTPDAVQESLPKRPTIRDLREQFYTVYEVSVQEDREWDGAVQVRCAEGWLLYPYRLVEGKTRDEALLITRYRTYVHDSATDTVSSWWGRVCDAITSFFGNIHWSNFRNRVEGIGGTKQ